MAGLRIVFAHIAMVVLSLLTIMTVLSIFMRDRNETLVRYLLAGISLELIIIGYMLSLSLAEP